MEMGKGAGDSSTTDSAFSSAVIALNSVVSVLMILVAAYANHCLLARDDARRWRDGADDDEPQSYGGDTTSGDTNTAPWIARNCFDGALGSPLLSPPNSPTSPHERWLWVPLFASHTTIGGSSVESFAAGPVEGHWMIFCDLKSVLFMLVIACSLAQAITLLALTLPDPRHLNSDGSRRLQDIISLFQAQLFFLYFTVLCILLFRFGDVSGQMTKRRFCIILWSAIAGLFVFMSIALALLLMDILPIALEIYGTVCQVTLAVCFAVVAVIIPRRIVRYGETMAPIATKIRRVTLTAVLSLTVRLVIFLPIVQSRLSIIGPFASTIFFTFSLLPVAASLHLLHSRVDRVRASESLPVRE